MSSITTWNRLEPRPRTNDTKAALAAPLRDPLWLLTRQWQMGEFHGEDAGSPAFTTLTTSTAAPTAWRAGTAADRPLPRAPLDATLTREELTPADVSLAVELGQAFEELLATQGASPATVGLFRATFPIAALAPGDDAETARFRAVCAGHVTDGLALFAAASPTPGQIPPGVALGATEEPRAIAALDAFVAWATSLYGRLDGADPPAWHPGRLAYEAAIMAPFASGERAILTATPDRDGGLDWYSFDLIAGTLDTGASATTRVFPGHVRFRGMPNARFWDFESAATDFGDVQPDRRDLSRMVLTEFVFLHANDWFVIPFEQGVGTFVRVDALAVRDVFGTTTVIPRAGSADPPGGGRWAMFATSTGPGLTSTTDAFFLAPGAGGARHAGDAAEDVRLVRDETANLVWGIEHTVTGALGAPRPALEAILGDRPPLPPPPETPDPSVPLQYRIQTNVPRNWVPFVPVRLDASGQIALELGGLLDPIHEGTLQAAAPAGRILCPMGLGATAYRVREEEVPRSGLRVRRVPFVSRWIDGSTHLWWGRSRSAGAGEGASGLRFDVAEPR